MSVRGWSWLVWTLVAASAVFWALQLRAPAHTQPAPSVNLAPPDLQQTSLARLGGGPANGTPVAGGITPPVLPNEGRFVLLGVVSPTPSNPIAALADAETQPIKPIKPLNTGLALIAKDSQPPRAYAVGDLVDGDWVLQAVSRRSASLGRPGQVAQLQLSISEPAAPARAAPLPAPAAAASRPARL